MRRALLAPLPALSLMLFLSVAWPARQLPAQTLGQTAGLAPGQTTGLANPAATFCQQCGGTLLAVDTPAGQSENCLLPFFGAIDEWTWWRLFHPQ